MNDRIYVCHTFYHAYISFLKELALREKAANEGRDYGDATMVLSKLSNDFKDSKKRFLESGIFKEVLDYDEKREDAFPGLEKYKKPGNMLVKTLNRIILTSKFAKALEADVPCDFKKYKDIYVCCDADPIGTYLNKHRIRYHAVEDGLNNLHYIDLPRVKDPKLFNFKKFLSRNLNLIVMSDGYGKYCVDMEVNNIAGHKYPRKNFVEVPRKELSDRLTDEDKKILTKAFIADYDKLEELVKEMGNDDKILILTDPLCTLDVREKIFRDIIKMYEKEGRIFLKPHPRDKLDYKTLFSDYPQFDATVPREILNFIPGVRFKKAIGVLTEMKAITFADEAIRLGADFMDAYEEPSIHRQNEYI